MEERREGVGVMKDEDLKLEEIEASLTLGGAVIHTYPPVYKNLGTGRVRTQKLHLCCHTHLDSSVSRA